MASSSVLEALSENRGTGFDFSLCARNASLADKATIKLAAKKTGTTIVGIVYKDGVVLGADTRATGGSIVCDKNCEKIHYIASNIYCCGAGTSADTESTTALISSQLELMRLSTGSEPRVTAALTRLKRMLFKYQGHVEAALVLGGVDVEGAHLHTVYPHGSTDKLPYATMGSGSLAAMSVFEQRYKDDLTEQEAIDLVDEAIQAGIFNDLGSGGNVDITVLSRVDGKTVVKQMRGHQKPNERLFRKAKPYDFPVGTTAFVEEKRRLFTQHVAVEEVARVSIAGESQAMEL